MSYAQSHDGDIPVLSQYDVPMEFLVKRIDQHQISIFVNVDPDLHRITTSINDFLAVHLCKDPRDGKVVRVWPQPQLITHVGTSQYRFQNLNINISASGLCASNFVRLVFEKYHSGVRDINLLQWVLSRKTFKKYTDVAQYFQRSDLLRDTNDRYAQAVRILTGGRVPGPPFFSVCTDGGVSVNSFPSNCASFTTTMAILRRFCDTLSAAVITCGRRIVAVMKFPLAQAAGGYIYLLYDSHDDFLHQGGAAITVLPIELYSEVYLSWKFDAYRNQQIRASFVVAKLRPFGTSLTESELELLSRNSKEEVRRA